MHRPNPLVELLFANFDIWKLVLPQDDRVKALFEAHNMPHVGHLGVEKTYARYANHYYWPGIYYETCRYVRACQECQAHKVYQQAPADLMEERYIDGPWTVPATDIIGPKLPSKQGHRYTIVFEELFTCHIEIRATRKADAKSVLQAFDELIINRWGCPNGTESANKMVTERLQQYGITQSTIRPYHAQAKPVERVNQNLRTTINGFLRKDHRERNLHLSQFAFALNSMVFSSIKISPAFINFGRNPQPCMIMRQHLDHPAPIRPPDPALWLVRVNRLPELHDLVKRPIEQATAK